MASFTGKPGAAGTPAAAAASPEGATNLKKTGLPPLISTMAAFLTGLPNLS